MRIYVYKGCVLSNEEVTAYFGDETTRPYCRKLYRGEITIDDIPEELREAVQTTVNNRIDRWGAYADQPVSVKELRSFVAELATE